MYFGTRSPGKWASTKARGAVRLTIKEVPVVISKLKKSLGSLRIDKLFRVRLGHILLL